MKNLESTPLRPAPQSLQAAARAILSVSRLRVLAPEAAEEFSRYQDHATIEEMVSRRGLKFVTTIATNYATELGRG